MPVVTSYPGIYIQELPSNTHTIAAAPTSVTVFVGYVHPFKTAPANFGLPLEIFSFSDYERLFGGFYQSSVIDANVSYAVNEFFENGGTDAFVVGLMPSYYDVATGTKTGAVTPGTVILDGGTGVGVLFTALQPTDIPATAASPGTVMTIAIANVQPAATNVADITITYGSQQEVYRKVTLDNTKPDFLETRINNVSALVTVGASTAYPTAFTTATGTINQTPPAGTTGVINATDFTAVFQADTPLDKLPLFNLLVTPGISKGANSVQSEALAFCERKLAFYIMDPPVEDVADPPTDWIGDFMGAGDTDGNVAPQSPNGALYFPYLQSTNPVTGVPLDPNGNPFILPPSGYVAGIYAATDSSRGVWKAPAGYATTLLDTTGVVPTGLMTDTRQGVLNLIGVNCIRSFPGAGTVVFGARTLVSANQALQQWKYVPVRRMALFIEQTLKTNLTWVIFEPNDDPLWVAIRISIESFMLSLFNQGAFAGTTPSDAFQVKCDSTTTTPDDQANGVVNIIVAFAPLRPAEFVVVKIAQLAGQAQS
ncbi:MAG: phage tail sheath subtilisin-like domain-containing protein [Bryobacteraceae bacterium]|jgi:phage tail sheath protein FI